MRTAFLVLAIYAMWYSLCLSAVAVIDDEAVKQGGRLLNLLAEEVRTNEAGEQIVREAAEGAAESAACIRLNSSAFSAILDAESGNLYWYSHLRDWPPTEVPANPLVSEALSKADAFAELLPLLELLGLPDRIDDYNVRFVDYTSDETELAVDDEVRNPSYCFWEFRRHLDWKGKPCRNREFRGAVGGYSGGIGIVLFRDVVEPQSIARNITYDTALSTAKEWLQHSTYFNASDRVWQIDEIKASKRQDVIAHRNSFPDEALSRMEECASKTAYVCWEVPFSYFEGGHWFRAVAWVDINTGEVIGGDVTGEQVE